MSNDYQCACLCRVVELLLHNDARPGIRDNEGYNAVHYAALKGHRLALEMVSTWLVSLSFLLSLKFAIDDSITRIKILP